MFDWLLDIFDDRLPILNRLLLKYYTSAQEQGLDDTNRGNCTNKHVYLFLVSLGLPIKLSEFTNIEKSLLFFSSIKILPTNVYLIHTPKLGKSFSSACLLN